MRARPLLAANASVSAASALSTAIPTMQVSRQRLGGSRISPKAPSRHPGASRRMTRAIVRDSAAPRWERRLPRRHSSGQLRGFADRESTRQRDAISAWRTRCRRFEYALTGLLDLKRASPDATALLLAEKGAVTPDCRFSSDPERRARLDVVVKTHLSCVAGPTNELDGLRIVDRADLQRDRPRSSNRKLQIDEFRKRGLRPRCSKLRTIPEWR